MAESTHVDAFPAWEQPVPSACDGGTLEDDCEEDGRGAADNITHHDPTNSSESLLDTQFVDVKCEDRCFGHHEGRVIESRETVRQLSSHMSLVYIPSRKYIQKLSGITFAPVGDQSAGISQTCLPAPYLVPIEFVSEKIGDMGRERNAYRA